MKQINKGLSHFFSHNPCVMITAEMEIKHTVKYRLILQFDREDFPHIDLSWGIQRNKSPFREIKNGGELCDFDMQEAKNRTMVFATWGYRITDQHTLSNEYLHDFARVSGLMDQYGQTTYDQFLEMSRKEQVKDTAKQIVDNKEGNLFRLPKRGENVSKS